MRTKPEISTMSKMIVNYKRQDQMFVPREKIHDRLFKQQTLSKRLGKKKEMESDIKKRKEELAREKYEKYFKSYLKQKKEKIDDQNSQQQLQEPKTTTKRSSKAPKFDNIGTRLYKKGVEKKIEKEKFI